MLAAQAASCNAKAKRRKVYSESKHLSELFEIPRSQLSFAKDDIAVLGSTLDIQLGTAALQLVKQSPTIEVSSVSEFLQQRPTVPLHGATQELIADTLGISRSTLSIRSMQHFSTSLQLDRFVRYAVPSALASCSGYKFLQDIDGILYDATPLPLLPQGSRHVKQVADSSALVVRNTQFELSLPSGQSCLSANILQTKKEFGWLFAKTDGDTQRFLFIVGHSASHLQNLVSNKATTMLSSMAEQNAVSSSSHRAESTTRLVGVDRHPSNLVVERKVLRQRRKCSTKWSSIVSTCCQHKLGCVRFACTAPFEDTVTGIVNITRALYSVTYLKQFREAFYMETLTRTRVRIGMAPAQDRSNHRHILKWFLPRGPDTLAQKVLLELMATGNWGDEDSIDIYILHQGQNSMNRLSESKLPLPSQRR